MHFAAFGNPILYVTLDSIIEKKIGAGEGNRTIVFIPLAKSLNISGFQSGMVGKMHHCPLLNWHFHDFTPLHKIWYSLIQDEVVTFLENPTQAAALADAKKLAPLEPC